MRTSSRMADGTVLINLTLPHSAIAGKPRMLFASTTRPPQLRGTNNSNTDRSKQIEVEASVPSRSCAENTVDAQFTKVAALW